MRIADKMAKAIDGQESRSFDPLPAGVYTGRMIDAEARQSSNGNPMWSVTFEVVDEEYAGRRLWVNLVFVDNALWKVKEFADAFGVTAAELDTDELIGECVKLAVSERIIPTGNRAGQVGNNVDRVMRLTDGGDDAEAPEPKSAAKVKTGAKPIEF